LENALKAEPFKSAAESEALFRQTFEHAAVGLAHVAPDGSWLQVNRRLCEITGYSERELLSKKFQDITHPDDLKADLHNAARLVRGDSNSYNIEKRYLRKNGSPIWVRLTAAAMRGDDGAIDHFISVVEDIGEQKQAELALRESEERLRLANEAASIGTFSIDLEKGMAFYSAELAAILGFPGVQAASVESALARVHRDDLPRVRTLYESIMAKGDSGQVKMDFRFVRPGGEVRWMTWIGRADFRERVAGRVLRRIVGACLDITERKQQEEQISLLMREVNHRSQNILNVVRSIARQTVASGGDDFLRSFEERLLALSASHYLLVKNEWKGAGLEELVSSQLEHFKDLISTRINVLGPPLMVRPAAAQAIGMALHELATNAGKYGALSQSKGKVIIHWNTAKTDQGVNIFVMDWQEEGGPLVTTPKRRGFGSTLLQQVLELNLNAEVKLDYAPSGLGWRLRCQANNVLEGTL
jgi:PAS domain S-box-containing protein